MTLSQDGVPVDGSPDASHNYRAEGAMKFHHRLAALLSVCCLIAVPTARGFELMPADDGETAGQTLTVRGEVVSMTLLGGVSGFDNRIAPPDAAPGAALSCRTLPAGFTALLGCFDARTELGLTLATPEGDVWTMGPAVDNGDLVPHARLSATGPDTVLVEWEDLNGGGDADYNDCLVELKITPAR